MDTPSPDQLQHWLKVNQDNIERSKVHYREGFYQKENIALQSAYIGIGMDHADLGRSRYLNGEALDVVRAEFIQAAHCTIKSFTMAYDRNDPDYVGDNLPAPEQLSPDYNQVDWSEVNEVCLIEGLNYALMGADLGVARQLAAWYQDRKDGRKMEPIINRYAYAYKYGVLGQDADALALLDITLAECRAKPPKKLHHINYYTKSLMLNAVLQNDAALLEDCLFVYLEFYRKSVIRAEDYFDTPEAFMCDAAVAMANLARFKGIAVTLEHPLLARRLLLA